MKEFRKKIKNLVLGFKSGYRKQYDEVICIAHHCIIEGIFLAFTLVYLIVLKVLKIYSIMLYLPVAITILVIQIIYIASPIRNKLMDYTGPVIIKIIFLLGRNGDVVSQKDWKRIKREDPELYRDMWKSKKYKGHCYYYARRLAMQLEGAELLYLSIMYQGRYISHVVVKKADCVFDTNARIHFNLSEYLNLNNAKIYSTFSKQEYSQDEFFEQIRDDLKKYCQEHDIFCDPE